ncbi:hypothetical protein [Oceanobacillus locisalsi]|uniref:Uncharacterized protein n=1 Tax=Oceanobacillus locisalsi TaxID=546107 RepID=A0ABW3NGF0_9BACI
MDINERFQKEKDCYLYNRKLEAKALRSGNAKKALVYAENATRSLEEVMKIEKYMKELKEIKFLVTKIDRYHAAFLESRI